MKSIRKTILICICSSILFTCKSDDDSSGNVFFELIGSWIMVSSLIVEAGQPTVDVTPLCLLELIITANYYQELAAQSANCNDQVLSDQYPYELSNNRLKIFDMDNQLMYDFNFNAIDSDTFEATLTDINGQSGIDNRIRFIRTDF